MIAFEIRGKLYQFKPTWLATLITLICIPICIHLGQWQYQKAQKKIAVQRMYALGEHNGPKTFPLNINPHDQAVMGSWKYQLVELTGVYTPQYQILWDNQVEQDQAGFHVLTPLKIAGTEQYVLVDRGWVQGKTLHTEVPTFDTPTGTQVILGNIWLPPKKYFSLEAPQAQSQQFQYVWQNVDVGKYQKQVPIAVSPLVVRLDQSSEAGGFVRNWQEPVSRIFTNLGYAYQWFGFAFAALCIYLYQSLRITKLPNAV